MDLYYDKNEMIMYPPPFAIFNDTMTDETESSSIILSSLLGVVLSLIAFTTAMGNIIVLLAFYCDKKLRTINVPDKSDQRKCISYLMHKFRSLTQIWPFGRLFCKIWVTVDDVATMASVINIVAITVNRYWSIAYPIVYRRYMKQHFVSIVMGGIWCLSFLNFAPGIWLINFSSTETNVTRTDCSGDYNNSFIYMLIAQFNYFIWPFIVLCVLNMLIMLNIWKRSRKMSRLINLHHFQKSKIENPMSSLHGTEKDGEDEQRTLSETKVQLNPLERRVTLIVERNENLIQISSSNQNLNALCQPQLPIVQHRSSNSSLTVRSLRKSASTNRSSSRRYQSETVHDCDPDVSRANFDDRGSSFRYRPKYREYCQKRSRIIRDRKAARSLFILVIVFLIFLFPYVICATASTAGLEISSIIYEISFWLLWMNSTCNPVLYPFIQTKYRKAYLKLFRSCRKLIFLICVYDLSFYPMRETISVTSSTQNKLRKRLKKSTNLSNHEFTIEQIQKTIPLLAQAFAHGFFIEVNCRTLSENLLDQLAYQVYEFVQKQEEHLNRSLIFHSFDDYSLLKEFVRKIFIGDFEENQTKKRKEIHSMNIFLYKTKDDHPSIQEILVENEKQQFASRWSLPHEQFESLWETLEYDLPLKSQLMQYVFTVIRFDKANIDRTVLHCNQTILLYGPPGCGKTTLCKGLAQKVSIRMKELFSRFYFYELNAGSLFSKWFSESSHNLTRFFHDITQICLDPMTFVIILIDEIESLSMSRTSSLSSNEPSDMLRVVNTLLTQIDRLKSFSNILILTTSNLIEIIDQALIDRSDLTLFIGPPSLKTIFHIFQACLDELIEKNLIHSSASRPEEIKDQLWSLAKESDGLSGRTLRKLPMIAFSYIQQSDDFIQCDELFNAMHEQLKHKRNTNDYLQQLTNS
ncbi:unnamed protein product [Adineta ricciae]|uniref:G-protein coupled receptors family 1 profile domain-containing protein n=1 Tax=Adineta ricciae TaxID=249248 RepID=A0A815IKY9_ADIRI|nr:unnamed protein product [Adineta ricciae]